jgi:hypothetical protein
MKQAAATGFGSSAGPSCMGQFPILNFAALRMLPKATKRGDLERMLHSPQSEDWVTWNLLNLLRTQHPLAWWQQVATVARAANPGLTLSISEQDQPRVEFWRRAPSPVAYEEASRAKMRQSADPYVAARRRNPKPVEGDSEIDVVFSTKRHLVFHRGAPITMTATITPLREDDSASHQLIERWLGLAPIVR